MCERINPRRWENRVRWFSWVTRTSYHVRSSVITDLTVRPRCSGSRNEPGTGRGKYPRVRWMVRCLVAEWQSAWTACGILKSRTRGFSHKLNTHSWRGWTNCFYNFLHVSTVLVILVLFSFGFFWDLRDSQKFAGKFPTSRSGKDDGGDGQQPGDVPRPGSALWNAVNVNTYKLFFRRFKYIFVLCCIFLRWSHLLQLFHAPGIRQLCLGCRKVMLRKQAWVSWRRSHEYICGCSFCSFTHTERDTATKPFCDRIVWTLNFNMK